mgnify:CR=1 FL=1
MSRLARIVTADCFEGQYQNQSRMIDAMLGRLKLAGKQDGWLGFALHDAEWRPGKPDMAVIAIQPGTGDVSVADVRAHLLEKKKQERTAA